MERLHEVLMTQRAEIIQRWTETMRRRFAPAVPMSELLDHLPAFLDELTYALRPDAAADPTSALGPVAAEHGVQRYRLGFNIEVLVWEYGMLRQCIFDVARDAGLAIAPADGDVLFRCLLSGIADAVRQYAEEREVERQRHANEHFAFLAHELRNPLAAACLSHASLKNKGLLPASRQVEVLEKALGRMRDLIEDTLRMTLAGAGAGLQLRPIKVHDLIAEASVEAAVQAEEKGVRIELRAPGAEEIEGDHRLLLSALNNLIRNAVKFTHPGTVVRVNWQEEDGQMNISVEDGCGGLPPGRRDALFAPFVQGGADRSGFGLGLAIAKRAAEAHGGSIRVRDLPGKGCVFTLSVPAASRAASSA